MVSSATTCELYRAAEKPSVVHYCTTLQVCTCYRLGLMDSPHLSKERLHALMFETVHLTEQEDAHITGWHCSECQKTMFELINPKENQGKL